MPMTERVRRLRQQSLDAEETLSGERAALLTEFYRTGEARLAPAESASIPVQRALAFQYLLAHKKVFIAEGELIVGEKGPAPKAAPTYPELCCHSLADLALLDARPKIPFRVSPAVRRLQAQKIIPFWQGRTMRERVFEAMTPEWKAAYEAGIFTEFMEQRAPGHTVLDGKIYQHGMLDFIARIEARLAELDPSSDPAAPAMRQELQAMRICAAALIAFARRYARAARRMAARAPNPARRRELERIAAVCTRVPARTPRDFHEALQYYWFVHLGVTLELNTWDSFSPGHLDRHLLPFYDLDAQPREYYEELLQCFWIKFNNQPAPPKVGVTAAESGTYTDFAQVNLGGILADGSDGVNPVTYLLLDVIESMRLLQPSSSIQVSRLNPDAFIHRAAQIIRTGFGQPSVFNADLVVRQMLRLGKSLVDAREGGTSGCVETGAFGKEAYILTGYFNIPKVLELTLHGGRDPHSGEQLGLHTGDPVDFASFDDLFAAFEQQLQHFIGIKVEGSRIIERLYADLMPAPFLSLLVDDCIRTGRDYHAGGARYNTSYIQGVGMGTITDCLSSLKTHVYQRRTMSMAEMLALLAADFEGKESARQVLINKTPRYGNDDPAADDLLARVFESCFNAVDGRPNARRGEYHLNLLPTTCHIYFGSVTGATPDGRRAAAPLSEGISPVQGADRRGPTAVLHSAARLDQVRTGGTLLNQKFTPALLADETGLAALVGLIRTYFKMDGHHVQFNVVDAATLRRAQQHPEQYRDLIVRVAGYSDYFCDLSEALQEEIITRTEHQVF